MCIRLVSKIIQQNEDQIGVLYLRRAVSPSIKRAFGPHGTSKT